MVLHKEWPSETWIVHLKEFAFEFARYLNVHSSFLPREYHVKTFCDAKLERRRNGKNLQTSEMHQPKISIKKRCLYSIWISIVKKKKLQTQNKIMFIYRNVSAQTRKNHFFSLPIFGSINIPVTILHAHDSIHHVLINAFMILIYLIQKQKHLSNSLKNVIFRNGASAKLRIF